MISVKTKCPWCGETSTVTVTRVGYEAWVTGTKIQDAFPELSASDRERLISGVCGPCWDEEFSDDE